MAEKLDPEAKRLRNISAGDLADAIGALEARVEVLKAEAIRRELHRAEGEAYRIVLTPPTTDARSGRERPAPRPSGRCDARPTAASMAPPMPSKAS